YMSNKIVCWLLFNSRFFAGGDLSSELVCNCLPDLALDGKNSFEIAIIGLCPEMHIAARVDQARIHSDTVVRALHTRFHQMRHVELLRDSGEIARFALILLRGRPRNHF